MLQWCFCSNTNRWFEDGLARKTALHSHDSAGFENSAAVPVHRTQYRPSATLACGLHSNRTRSARRHHPTEAASLSIVDSAEQVDNHGIRIEWMSCSVDVAL